MPTLLSTPAPPLRDISQNIRNVTRYWQGRNA